MRFYKLYSDEGKRKKFAYGIETDVGQPLETINCTFCGRLSKKREFLTPTTIVLSNNHYPDFMRLALGDIVLSDRAKGVLEEEQIKGYCLKEIVTTSPKNTPVQFQKLLRDADENLKKMPDDPPKYYKWETTSKAALHVKTGLEVVNCSVCGYFRAMTPGHTIIIPDHPKFIDKVSWDGSDVFSVDHAGKYHCSERFYEVYHKHQLTGLEFTEIPSL